MKKVRASKLTTATLRERALLHAERPFHKGNCEAMIFGCDAEHYDTPCTCGREAAVFAEIDAKYPLNIERHYAQIIADLMQVAISDVYKNAHLRGQLSALRSVRRWLHECWGRNVDFQLNFPKAPKYQLYAAKYGALTQEAHLAGLDTRIEKAKALLKRVVKKKGAL